MSKYLSVNKILLIVLFIIAGLFTAPVVIQKVENAFSCSCFSHVCGSQCTTHNNCTPGDCSCYPQGACGCGSCPPATPGNPNPPATSGGGSGGGNPPPPACNPTNPGVVTSVSPANGAVNLDKPVTFTWTPTGGWGNGCPTDPNYYIYYKVKQGADCVAGSFSYYGPLGNVLTGSMNSQLQWGTTYCWRVGRNNGSLARYTEIREFTTNGIPQLVAGSNRFLNADVCGRGASGQFGQAGVTNPVQYTFEYEEPEGNDTYREVWFSMVPATSLNTVNPLVNTVQAQARQNNSFSVKIDVATGGVSAVTTPAANATQKGTYGPAVTSGALTISSGNPLVPRASIINIGTGTRAVVNGRRITATIEIRFENNYLANNYNMYGTVMITTPTGREVTAHSYNAQTFVYQRMGTWRVDVIPPTVTLTGPTLQSNGNYIVGWNSTDNVALLETLPYIYSDVEGARIRDNTANPDIILATPGTPQTYPASVLQYFGVTSTSQGNRNYTDLDPALSARYSFRYYARDTACNLGGPRTVSTLSIAPWNMGVNGDVSGGEGISGMVIPNLAAFPIPFATPAQTGPAFLSTYGSFSGTSETAEGNVSKFNQSITSYVDNAAIPDEKATNGTWFDYLLDLAKKNNKTPFATIAGNKTISTRMSGVNGIGNILHEKRNVQITGNLIINSGTVCDVKSAIFVSGTLTINPDFTIQAAPQAPSAVNQTYNGCLFIVRGDVTLGVGVAKTTVGFSSATLASYDQIYAYIISDGIINVPQDNFGAATRKWDALYISGGLVNKVQPGQKMNLQRDLNLNANTLQPAMVVNHDPRYKLTFLDDFASRIYSLREVGL